MKIPSASQTRILDEITMQKHYDHSHQLMEYASNTFVNWFKENFKEREQMIHIFCGSGNNGGDGLAIARLLHNDFYQVKVYLCALGASSPDNSKNQDLLPSTLKTKLLWINEGDEAPKIKNTELVIDAIFGSGINRAVEGYWASLIKHINQSEAEIISVDMPSGLYTGFADADVCMSANRTFAFEFPKLPFMLPAYAHLVGEWEFKSIGLDKEAISKLACNHFYIDKALAASLLKKRKKFSHKGSYGHALLIMSKYGMVGAALLAGRACLRSGTGLLSLHVPKVGYSIVQSNLPEAIVSIDRHEFNFSTPPAIEKYSAVGIGCGLGQQNMTKTGLRSTLEEVMKLSKPLLLDADALNILASEESLWEFVPPESILTPHPKECERLFGESQGDMQELKHLSKISKKHQIHLILKRANTVIFCPDGEIYFNSTGNPGMATAGSGDVLSGIITGLLAQGYAAKQACILGVYLHGLSADLAVEHFRGEEALIASDIIEFLGNAFLKTKQP